jgi:hypothetical protein
MPFSRFTLSSTPSDSAPFSKRLVADDIVHRAVRHAVERDDALALRRDGQHMLVAENADIGLFRQCRLQRQRAALHIGDVGLESVFLEDLLLLGDIERGGEVAVADIGDFDRLGCGDRRRHRANRGSEHSQDFHCASSGFLSAG